VPRRQAVDLQPALILVVDGRVDIAPGRTGRIGLGSTRGIGRRDGLAGERRGAAAQHLWSPLPHSNQTQDGSDEAMVDEERQRADYPRVDSPPQRTGRGDPAEEAAYPLQHPVAGVLADRVQL